MSNKNVFSKGLVPFAWENKPGIRKEDLYREDDDDDDDNDNEVVDDKGKRGGKTKLPPPPYLRQPESGRASQVNSQDIPLPPCAFQSLVSSRRRGSKRDAYKEEEDPFLTAYKKCINGGGSTRRSHKMSCKHSCSVIDGSIVRISQLPIPKPGKEIIGSFFKFDD